MYMYYCMYMYWYMLEAIMPPEHVEYQVGFVQT